MAHNLPDELLHEILGPSLFVPDELFADCGPRSPFSKTAISASRILLVCKRWMRVCTPWLYETVVIRSKAQAASLARALTRNPSFGSFIKKLRVEGGFDVSAVVGVAPNIRDVCFSLAIWSNDDETGIISILEYVNPRRVILTTHQAVSNAKFDQVLLTLCIMIGRWTHLERFVFPEYSPQFRRRASRYPYAGDEDMACIADALALREEPTVVVLDQNYMTFHDGPMRPIYSLLAPNVAISSILVTGIDYWAKKQRWKDFLPPGLRAITHDAQEAESRRPQVVLDPIVSTTSVGATVDHAFLNPFYEPLKSATPGVRKLILQKIITYACEHDGHFSHATPWYDTFIFDNGTARSLRRVSREFEHITTQVLCAHVRLLSTGVAARFLDVLTCHPECGALVRTLWSSLVLKDLPAIIPQCSNLREITIGVAGGRVHCARRHNDENLFLTPCTVRLIAQTTGATLQCLKLACSTQEIIDAAVFNAFLVLKSLTWACAFAVRPGDTPVTLLQLQTLELLPGANPAFIDALAEFSLPALTDFRYHPHHNDCEDFLGAHGNKLKTVVTHDDWGERLLELAPNLETLTLNTMYSDSQAFSGQSHSKLHTIVLHWFTDKHHISEWKLLAKALTASVASSGKRSRKGDTPAYPALRIVKAGNLWGWPGSEREISKSPWPAIAEALLEQGITLLDRNDCGWRPRL